LPSLALLGKTALAGGMLVAGGLLALSTVAPSTEQRPAASGEDLRDPHPDADLDRLLIPVAGVAARQLIDTFADARANGRPHDAIDILAPLGTPVRAAADGTVEKLFVSKAGGNTVYVRSRSRAYRYYYAHLDRYRPGLREGETLHRGDAVGTVGYSGNADPAAPHLHFAVMRTTPTGRWWDSGEAINPYPLLR